MYQPLVNIYCNDLDALPVDICRFGRCFVCRSIGLIVVPIWTLLPDVVSYEYCTVASTVLFDGVAGRCFVSVGTIISNDSNVVAGHCAWIRSALALGCIVSLDGVAGQYIL